MSQTHDDASSPSRRQMLSHLGAAALLTAIPRGTHAHGAPPFAGISRSDMSDAEIERLLNLASVPSISMAVVEGDRITTRAIGVRRKGEGDRVTADTVYPAASLTKTVFAYILLGTVQDGLLSLDQPLRDILPLPNADDPHAGAITARRLLSHSGGWRNWRNTAAQALTSDFAPGSRWSYSGEGFFYLQRIVERLTGKAVGQLARERVFEPLGMTRSAMMLTAAMEPVSASGHGGRGDPVQPFGRLTLLELRRLMTERNLTLDAVKVEDAELALRTAEPTLPVLPNFLSPNAAASMQTTANDFARFLRHLVNAPAAGGRAAAIVRQMWTPQIRCNDAVQWGLGVGLEDLGTQRFAWQWGDNSGFKHFYLADAQGGRAIVAFTNGDRGARVYERVIRATLGQDHPAFLWA